MTNLNPLLAAYIDAWNSKDAQALSALIDEQIDFRSPTATTQGRADYIASAVRMFPLLERVETRSVIQDNVNAVLIYDFVCREPIGVVRTAEFITVAGDRVVRSELFFDTAPMTGARQQHAA